jgi:hypothetical protein
MSKRAVVFLLIFIYPLLPVFSKEHIHVSVGVILSSKFEGKSNLKPLEELINQTITFEMTKEGYTLIPGKGDPDNLLLQGIEQGASFVIECLYFNSDEELSLLLKCYRIEDKRVIASVKRNCEIGLNMDITITEAVGEILVLLKEEDIVPTELIINEPLDIAFQASAGFSPFLATGESSSYFKTGFMPEILVGVKISTDYGFLGFGLYSSLNYFQAEGVLVSSENYVVSLGPEFRIGLDVTPALGVFLRISSGGAFFQMYSENGDAGSTIVPYFSGGVGASLQFNSFMGVILSTNYHLYFENSLLFTGFSPSLGLNFIF